VHAHPDLSAAFCTVDTPVGWIPYAEFPFASSFIEPLSIPASLLLVAMSSQAEKLGIDLDRTLGALTSGVLITCFLNGAVLLQTVRYCRKCWATDPVFIRAWVCVATILATLSTAIFAAHVYRMTVLNWGNPSFLAARHSLVDAGVGKSTRRFGCLVTLPSCSHDRLVWHLPSDVPHPPRVSPVRCLRALSEETDP
jgi:hypothetical protein